MDTRSVRKLHARERTSYLRHHALPLIISRTSGSVAGFHRHGHLRRNAARDAPCGFGIRSDCAHRTSHRDRRAVRVDLAAGAATAAAAAPAVVPTRDRDAVREHPVSAPDGAGGALSAGDLQLFAAVAIAAIGFTFSGRLTAEMPGWEVISWVQVIALPISLPAAALTLPADLTHIALKPWLALLYVAVFSQWIGFFAWNAGMAMGGITRVSQVQLLQPFITFALAAWFNDETITLQILLFAAAVVATVAIGTRTQVRQTPVVQGSP